MNRISYFFSQPHQPFFALGVINAILFMVLFYLGFKWVLAIDTRFFHSYSMIFLVFTNLFLGFTNTTFPRFSQTKEIEPKRYLQIWLLNLIATISFLVSIYLQVAFYVSALVLAISFAYTIKIYLEIYKISALPKFDQYWIIVSYGMGAISNILFILASIPCKGCKEGVFLYYAISVGVYLYLIFLPALVAFKMVPFFSGLTNYKKNPHLNRTLFILLFIHTILGGYYPKWIFIVDLITAIYLTKEFLAINLPINKNEPLVWGLQLALIWLPLGFFLGSLVEFFEGWFNYYSLKLPEHLLFLGFLTTIFIAFATRVILGHSNRALRVDKIGSFIIIFSQIALLGRMALSIASSRGEIEPYLDISVTLWLLLFIFWGVKYLRYLFYRG